MINVQNYFKSTFVKILKNLGMIQIMLMYVLIFIL